MTARLMERDLIEIALPPVADFAGADPVYTDVFSMANCERRRFFVLFGVGTTGTIKFTVEACDNTTPSTVVAIPFTYRVTALAATPGAPTVTTAANGYTNAAGSNQLIEIEVDSEDLVSTGYAYCRVKLDEVVNDPILGGILTQAAGLRFANLPATATT